MWEVFKFPTSLSLVDDVLVWFLFNFAFLLKPVIWYWLAAIVCKLVGSLNGLVCGSINSMMLSIADA